MLIRPQEVGPYSPWPGKGSEMDLQLGLQGRSTLNRSNELERVVPFVTVIRVIPRQINWIGLSCI